jgi:hypothetical protein
MNCLPRWYSGFHSQVFQRLQLVRTPRMINTIRVEHPTLVNNFAMAECAPIRQSRQKSTPDVLLSGEQEEAIPADNEEHPESEADPVEEIVGDSGDDHVHDWL